MCLIIILYVNYSKIDDFSELIVILLLSVFIPVIIFYDFNPSVSLMFYFNGNRTNVELITYISSQLLAAWAAYATLNLIKFKKIKL